MAHISQRVGNLEDEYGRASLDDLVNSLCLRKSSSTIVCSWMASGAARAMADQQLDVMLDGSSATATFNSHVVFVGPTAASAAFKLATCVLVPLQREHHHLRSRAGDGDVR